MSKPNAARGPFSFSVGPGFCTKVGTQPTGYGQTLEIERLEGSIDSLQTEKSAFQSRIDSLTVRRDSLRTIKGTVPGILVIKASPINNPTSIAAKAIDNRAAGDTVRIVDGVDAGKLADFGFWEVVIEGKTGYVDRTHVRSEDAWLAYTSRRPEGFKYEEGAPQGSVGRTFSGNGSQTTQPFSVDGGWTLSWSTGEYISITVYKGDRPVATASGEGSGRSYVNEGGRVYLQVNGISDWTVKVNP